MSANEKIIVALDVESPEHALELAQTLIAYTQIFKIGSKLFTAAGPDLVRKIVALGAKVFLDLKYHDIPNIVAAASVEATRLGVFLLTVHAAGGRRMMKEAHDAAAEAAAKSGQRRPLLLGVTVLTSADSGSLQEIGVGRSLGEQVASLSRLCATAGLDGVIASPQEVRLIREAVQRPDFLVVTPGVRPAEISADDQRRVMTPAEAVKAGADYLVIGRPITGSSDPVKAVMRIIEEIEEASLP